MKTKHEMREAAIKRLRGVISNQSFVMTLCADDITKPLVGDGWSDSTVEEDAETIIDLLTDDDEDMGDYVKLPMDANGEVIHIGDEMAVCDYRFIVAGVGLADRTDVLFETDGDKSDCFPAKVCYHYRKPTVEDVLREFAVAMSERMHLSNGVATTIAEYAPRLQLKENE